jgi:glycosyltransferase involved in cell wall biosynthesis
VFFMWSVYIIMACGLPLRICNRRIIPMVTGLGPVLGSTGRRFRPLRTVIEIVYAYLMSGRNSRCINHNAEDREVLAKRLHASADKFFVTPGCGVDPELFPFNEIRPANDPPVIVMPARLIEDKGVLDAIEASNILRDRGVEHRMWFTGAVEPYPWIAVTQDMIDEAERRNPSIEFIGFQPSVVPIYAQCDIVCYPTRYPEGTPTVLIEAAASGRPAVTCDTVGAREIVIDGRTGFVVPQRDARAIADALERLLEDPELWERFRRAAYQHFLARYTKDAALRTTLAALESQGFTFTTEMTAPDFRLGRTAA